MKTALRKLIAFVFLLGITWFIYRDFDNVLKGRQMLQIAALVGIFGLFWLIVPQLVIDYRVFRRRRKNRRRLAAWTESTGGRPRPIPAPRRLGLKSGENLFWHEKGTLYVNPGAGFDEVSVPGAIGDVAFPDEAREWRKVQRMHFFLSDRRLMFSGSHCTFERTFEQVLAFHDAPGGLVMTLANPSAETGLQVAFTFGNPLAAAAVLRELTRGRDSLKSDPR